MIGLLLFLILFDLANHIMISLNLTVIIECMEMLIVDGAESIIQKRNSEPYSTDQKRVTCNYLRQDMYIQFWVKCVLGEVGWGGVREVRWKVAGKW